MLVYSSNKNQVWKGEPINGIRHPKDIESKWSSSELLEIGLEIFVTQPTVQTLEESQRIGYFDIDNQAEGYRQKFLTSGIGQAMTYQQKEKEAEQVLTAGESVSNALTEEQRELKYPVLSASVGIEADTLYNCAILVSQTAKLWLSISNSIEKKRLKAKKDIKAATSINEIDSIKTNINWSV